MQVLTRLPEGYLQPLHCEGDLTLREAGLAVYRLSREGSSGTDCIIDHPAMTRLYFWRSVMGLFPALIAMMDLSVALIHGSISSAH